MTEFTKGILVALVPALIVSIVSAYLTTRLSIGNFYSQKWWEKKAEAYSRIMQSLVHLKYCYENWVADSLWEKQLSDSFKEELNKQYAEAEQSLEEATSSGAFIISDKAAYYLEELKEKWGKVPSWQTDEYQHYEQSLTAVKDCISNIRECARIDLHKK